MAAILPDRDIKKLVGKVLIDAEDRCIKPNSIELRLGTDVKFHSTGEEKKLNHGNFLKVNPGESVIITSFEKIDFRADTVHSIFPDSMLLGFITPTTTMMREGIFQVATKIDAGFYGTLNWGLRNGSTKDLIIQHGEPIFKLTIFRLDEDESPDIPYGGRDSDHYHKTSGIESSARQIPADISKENIVSSTIEELDPKKQLREAGYPFDHIGTELTALHGKFEMVSKEVLMMKDEFTSKTKELSDKIGTETQTLSEKIGDISKNILDQVEIIFDRKFWRVTSILIATISILYAGTTFLQARNITGNPLAFIAVIVGILAIVVTYALSKPSKKG